MCQYSHFGPLGQFPNSGQFSGSSPGVGSDEVNDCADTSSSFFSQSSGTSWCVCHRGTGRKPVRDLALAEGDDVASVVDEANTVFAIVVVPNVGDAVMPTSNKGATVACWGLGAAEADEVVEAAGVFGIELNSAADFRGASDLS